MIISISDDSLNKDEREIILTHIGLYEDVDIPSDYGGVTIKNEIEYEIEPLVINNQLIGVNFYSRIPFG